MGGALGSGTLAGFVSHVLFMSLPNLLTIFLAIGLFCSLYPLRENGNVRLVLASVVCAALSFASGALHYGSWIEASLGWPADDVASLVFFAVVLLACIPLSRWVFELERWDAIFCCTAGYALQNFSHAVYELANILFLGNLRLATWATGASQLAIAAVVFAAGWHAFIKNIRTNRLEGEGDRRTIVVLAAVIAINIVLDVAIRVLQEMGAVTSAGFLVMRLLQLFACGLTLVVDYEILYSNRMREDAAATRQLMEDQRRQYQVSQETIEAINVRCHDIRHQIRQLGGAAQANQEFMDDLSGLVSVYDSSIATGNRALDTILTEKSMLCQGKGIGLTCTVGGAALGFMAEQDIYSLFGNALDNAIEAVEELDDPDLRLIDVTTRKTGSMIAVQVRNFYAGDLRFVGDGRSLASTKGAGLHGYGTKSMRLICERYGGTMSVDANNGMFRLTLLLPVPSE